MNNIKPSTTYILKWEGIQLVFFVIFLLLSYLHEISIVKLIMEPHDQIQTIQSFLNGLQIFFLPKFFFFEFFPLLLISISLIIFKKWRWFFLALFGLAISILLISDRIYNSFFSSLITTNTFLLTGQIWDVRSAILKSITLTDIFNILIFVIFIFFGVYYNRKMKMGLSESGTAFAIDKILGILFCLLAIYCYNIAFFIPKRYIVIAPDGEIQVSKKEIEYKGAVCLMPNHEASARDFASTFGMINFHVKDISDAIQTRLIQNRISNSPPPENFYSFFEHKQMINKIKSPFWGIGRGRNVFLIHFESLSPLVIGLKIGDEPITPTLNDLEKNSLYWDSILDQVTIGGSSDAEFAVLTGLLPSTTKISAFSTSCMPYIRSLPRELKSHGYQTISLHGNNSAFYNRNISQSLLGFEYMYFKESYKIKEALGMGVSDKEFFNQAFDLLKNHQSPFFAFLMTLSSHYPYGDVPQEYQHLFNQNIDSGSIFTRYIQLLRYADDALGEFLLEIKNSSQWENSLFIIYGDHRPGMNDEMSDEMTKITGKSIFLPRYCCVPVMIVIPGHENLILEYKNQIKNTIGGLYDIYPTIMHLLGDDTPIGVFGSHLFVDNKRRDPVLFFRLAGSFVYNGIVYRQQGSQVQGDQIGVVFSDKKNDIILNGSERLNLYKQSILSKNYCNYIYESARPLF